eukprot:58_1
MALPNKFATHSEDRGSTAYDGTTRRNPRYSLGRYDGRTKSALHGSKLKIDCTNFTEAYGIIQNQFNIKPFIDDKFNKCYCDRCEVQEVYYRDDVPWYTPIGWAKMALKAPRAEALEAFKWPVCYHGTSLISAQKILNAGQILPPGSRSVGNEPVKTKQYHIKTKFYRFNTFLRRREMFDPNQVFISPSYRYASRYSQSFDCGNGRLAKVCFVGRIHPKAFNRGQQTLHALNSPGSFRQIDKHIPNSSIEWYTKSAVSIVLVGLLVKVYDAPPPRPPLRSKKYYDGVPFDYDRDFDYEEATHDHDHGFKDHEAPHDHDPGFKDDEATYGDHSPRREDEATYGGRGVKDAADPKHTDDIKAKCDHSDDTYSKYETIGAVIDECDETKNAELHDANEYKTPDSIPNSIVVDHKDDSNGNNVKDTNTDKVHEYIDEKGRAWKVGSVCIRKNTKCIVKEIDYQYKCVIVAPLDDPNYEINTEFRLISVVDDDEDTITPEGANGDAVSWSYRGSDGSWIRYDNSTSQRLEAAFCLKRTSVILDDNNIEIKMVYSKQPRFAQISGSERTEVMREGPEPADFIKEMLKSADFY